MEQAPKAEILKKGVSSGHQPYRRSSRCEEAAATYFQQFGPGLQSLRSDLRPHTFSSQYSSEEISDANTELAQKQAKYTGDKTEHGQEAEVVFLQLLRDHKLLGKDVRIIPTSEYDDELPGIDFIIEVPSKNGTMLRLGIDTTTTHDAEKIAQKERGGQQKTLDSDGDHFSYCDGAVRKARFFRSDTYSGIFSSMNKTKRGILVPLVVVQLTRQEIDTYLTGIYDEGSNALRAPRQCANQKEVVESGALVLRRMLVGIDAQLRRLGLPNPRTLFPEERTMNNEATSQLQHIKRFIEQSLDVYQTKHPNPVTYEGMRESYKDAISAIDSIKNNHNAYLALFRTIKQKNPEALLSFKSLYQAYKRDDLSAFDALSKVLSDAKGSSSLLQNVSFEKKEYARDFAYLAGFETDEHFMQNLKNGDKPSQHIKRVIDRLRNQREFFVFLSDYLSEVE